MLVTGQHIVLVKDFRTGCFTYDVERIIVAGTAGVIEGVGHLGRGYYKVHFPGCPFCSGRFDVPFDHVKEKGAGMSWWEDYKLFFVFDVESIGVFGEGFSVGFTVVERDGTERDFGRFACDPRLAAGDMFGHQWVDKHVPPTAETSISPDGVRFLFWDKLKFWKRQGAVLVADCPFPVEARFLIDCMNDVPQHRRPDSPYPLLDVATARMMAGKDPLAAVMRLPANENPPHDPLADARQSARLLLEAMNTIRNLRTFPPSTALV